MGFFGIGQELQFGVPNHIKQCVSPCRVGEGECCYRGEKEDREGYSRQRVHGFSLAESLLAKRSFFLLLDSGRALSSGLPTLSN